MAQTAKALGWIPNSISHEEIRGSKSYLGKIQLLKSLITAEQEIGTNIININVISKDPHESALVANTVAQAYRDYNIREKNRKTFETKAFIEEQLRLTSIQLKQAEVDLQVFKENYALISMDDQTRNTLNRLYGVEAEYEKTKIQKNEVETQIKTIEKKFDLTRGKIERTLVAPDRDSPIHDLRVQLSGLLIKRETLLIDFTEEHPQLIDINDQIQALIDEIRKELRAYLSVLVKRETDLLTKLNQLKKENQSLPERALKLVRLQRELQLQESLYSQLKTKYQETLIQESGKVEEVTIVKPALVPVAPFNVPSKMMIILTGIIMGLIIGIVFAFGAEVFDTSMGTIEDVENLLQVPVLGVIPFIEKVVDEENREGKKKAEKERKRELIAHYDPKSISSEAFRTLRSNLQFMSVDKKGKSFLVTSAFVQEGKTFNAINLALSIAQVGSRVLLLEADLRKPVIHRTFGLERSPGMTDCVLGNYQFNDIINTVTDVMLGDFELEEILKTPGLDNLNIITAGTQPPNPAEILRSKRFSELLQEAYQHYDVIILDSPPILPVVDATEIGPHVDGVIIVYTVGKIGRGVLKRAKMSLDNIHANVWGVILNNVKPEAGPDYFKYHTQYYYGPAKEAKQKKRRPLNRWFQKHLPPALQIKPLSLLILIMALTLLILGIFWKDLF
jgi:Mrp family chromosome partitioning ATPase/uncharacterized protein involved in exopolysaccharide biosynthesis